MLHITLPDGSQREFPGPVTVADVAALHGLDTQLDQAAQLVPRSLFHQPTPQKDTEPIGRLAQPNSAAPKNAPPSAQFWSS